MVEKYIDGVLDERERIIKLIEEDVAYQKTKLEDNFENDKSILWRITGMELLLRKLEE